ncbi:MAG: GNAT family N-acetyltransferase [Bacteroidota bacterium]
MTDIRKVGIESIAIIGSLAHLTWQTAYKDILSLEQMNYMLELIYSPAALTQQITVKGHQFVLIFHEEKPVGFASYSPREGDADLVYRLHKIYLDPSLKGKGLGLTLINYVINEVRSAGAQQLELNVNRDNVTQTFYKKLGFIILREEDIDIGNGYFMNDYVMSLPLR